VRLRDLWWFLGALGAIALALRLVHLAAIWSFQFGEPPEVGMDRWLQMHVAEAVARGDWLGGWSAQYDTGPAYGYWIGILYRLCGERWVGALLVQAVLGATTPVLAFAVGSRLYSGTAGVMAAVLTTLYVPTIFYEMLLVKFAVVPVAVLGLLFCLVRAREAPTARWLLSSGVTLGILVALRANALVFAPVAAWWLWHPLGTWRHAARVCALVGAGALIILGPLMLRDVAARRLGLGTSLWGIHFYIGNHPDADGGYSPVPGVRDDIVGHVVDARRIAEADERRVLSPHGVSLYWFHQGLRAISDEPRRAAALQLYKLRLAFEDEEGGSFGDVFDEYRGISRVLRLPLLGFGAICPLALLGLAVTIARRRPALLPLFIGSYLLSLLPFFVSGRYRLALVPPMIVLAAEALSWLGEIVRARRLLPMTGAAVLMALVLSTIDAGPYGNWIFVALLVLGVSTASFLESRGGVASRP
jgi:hypothetical protein